jgi:hypothetical protein
MNKTYYSTYYQKVLALIVFAALFLFSPRLYALGETQEQLMDSINIINSIDFNDQDTSSDEIQKKHQEIKDKLKGTWSELRESYKYSLNSWSKTLQNSETMQTGWKENKKWCELNAINSRLKEFQRNSRDKLLQAVKNIQSRYLVFEEKLKDSDIKLTKEDNEALDLIKATIALDNKTEERWKEGIKSIEQENHIYGDKHSGLLNLLFSKKIDCSPKTEEESVYLSLGNQKHSTDPNNISDVMDKLDIIGMTRYYYGSGCNSTEKSCTKILGRIGSIIDRHLYCTINLEDSLSNSTTCSYKKLMEQKAETTCIQSHEEEICKQDLTGKQKFGDFFHCQTNSNHYYNKKKEICLPRTTCQNHEQIKSTGDFYTNSVCEDQCDFTTKYWDDAFCKKRDTCKPHQVITTGGPIKDNSCTDGCPNFDTHYFDTENQVCKQRKVCSKNEKIIWGEEISDNECESACPDFNETYWDDPYCVIRKTCKETEKTIKGNFDENNKCEDYCDYTTHYYDLTTQTCQEQTTQCPETQTLSEHQNNLSKTECEDKCGDFKKEYLSDNTCHQRTQKCEDNLILKEEKNPLKNNTCHCPTELPFLTQGKYSIYFDKEHDKNTCYKNKDACLKSCLSYWYYSDNGIDDYMECGYEKYAENNGEPDFSLCDHLNIEHFLKDPELKKAKEICIDQYGHCK